MRARSWIACVLCAMTAASLHAQDSVVLQLAERGQAARANECATFGVPVPAAWSANNASAFRLTETDGTPIPAQFEILARWAAPPQTASAAAKWVLVSFMDNVASGSAHNVVLDHSGPGPAHATPISISAAVPGRLTVDTGAAVFELNTNSFNILNQVTIGGTTLLTALAPTSAIAYARNGAMDIAPGGSPDLTPRVTSTVVERAGPIHAVIRVRGSILMAPGQAVLDFTARLHFFAGSADVRLDFTVENNHPLIPGGGDQPTNDHNHGDPNSVHIGNLKLCLKLRDNGSAVRVLTERNVAVTAPGSTVGLIQEGSGISNWNAYVGLVGWPGQEASAAPRLQSYSPGAGYRTYGAGGVVTGMQAIGWMTAFRTNTTGPRLTMAVRDFRQNFPKALDVAPDGTASVNLFPNGSQFQHNLRIGEQKTHSILLSFGLGSTTAAESDSRARAFNAPLFGVAPAAWYTAALGEVAVANTAAWPLYERYVRTTFEPNPDYTGDEMPNTTLRDTIEHYNLLGWQDYGDVPIDFEAFGPRQAGQLNLKYWMLHATLVQFCRSGDMRWLDFARPAAWHLADIDILHIPDEGVSHWAHGAYYGHSQHDEPGNWNPNRNGNSPSVDLFFGVPDLLLGYCLTGERRFRDAALEALESMLSMSAFSDFTAPIPDRERANLIFGYIEGYRHTGDALWLTEARTIAGHTANLSNKSYLTNPDAYGIANPGVALKTFPVAQVLWAMGRYLDFCAEYGLADDLGVAIALQSFGDFIINYAAQDYVPGRSAVPYEYYFDHSDPSYLDINSWALTMADALSYAYKYSGASRFLQAATKFYATGTIDPAWQDDFPVYTDTKQLVNSLNWGLVYMSQATGGVPPSGPRARDDFDLNGDGRADPAVFDTISGNWYARTVAGKVLAWAVGWGWPGAAPVAGDFNGDRRSDFAVYDTASGNWYVLSSYRRVLAWAAWSQPDCIPVRGDYNGDSRSDLALFDPAAGRWYVRSMTGAMIAWATPWGWPGAWPVSGDYNGDGRSDLALFDSNTGRWFVRSPTGPVITWNLNWGWPGAWPVCGDYNGDGRSDYAVFDSNTGRWFIRSATGPVLAWDVNWGWPGAWPVSGDFNGDGRDDLAVFDSNTGRWFIRSLSGPVLAWNVGWGWPDATPIPGQ